MQQDIRSLLKSADNLRAEYQEHFHTVFPERIVGWWDPLHIEYHPEELEQGIAEMKKDVEKAIKTNVPIEEIPEEIWKNMIF